MKRIQSLFLVIVLAFVMIFGVSAAAETPSSVTVGTATGEKGDTVEIPVVLAGNKGFSCLGIEIGYNASALRLIDAVANSSTGATFTPAQDFTVNPYNLGWDSARNTDFNGTIATLTFEITANINGTYPITVDYYKGRNGNYIDGDSVNYNENFEPLNLTYISGGITVTGNNPPSVTGASVTVGTATGKKGDTVEIPVVLAGNKGFSCLGIEIGYNASALRLIDAVANSSTGATFTPAQDFTVNPYNLGWDSARNTDFNGTIATLTFEITANINGTYPITIDYYKGRNGNYIDGDSVNYNENFEPLNLTYISGGITVSEYTTAIFAEDISTADQVICKITLTANDYSGKVIGALYNADGQLLCLKTYDAVSSFDMEFDTGVMGSYVEIMWWSSFDSLRPLCNAEIVQLQ